MTSNRVNEISSLISTYVSLTESVFGLAVIFGMNFLFLLSFVLSVFAELPLFIPAGLLLLTAVLFNVYIYVLSLTIPQADVMEVFQIFLYSGLRRRYKLIQVTLSSFGFVFLFAGIFSIVFPVPTLIEGSSLSNFIGWGAIIVSSFGVSIYYYLFKYISTHHRDPEEYAEEVLEEYHDEETES